jgi:hypothetical protein
MSSSIDRSSVAQKPSEDRNAMAFPELLAWAWSETPAVHKNPANLLIHLFAVPLFVFGHLLLVAGIIVDLRLLIAAVLCIVVSLVLQNFAHSLEPIKPPPFMGARDFLRRLYAEQFCNFWRFLFSGRWYASLKARKTSD